MIKALRRKFILVNMLLVTIILLVVFFALCLSNYQRLEKESYAALSRALDRPSSQPAPKSALGGREPGEPFSSIPLFMVQLDTDQQVLWISEENMDVSEAEIPQLLESVLAEDQKQGRLSAYNLRYLVRSTPQGLKIAFAETSRENSFMRNILLTSTLVILLALSAFFIVSLFLSAWVLKPVERAWEQQRQFVADASHELKTPLTVILANTEILMAHREDQVVQQLKWIENTQQEANRMKKLVDHLLFLAKSDAGKMAPAFSRLDISDLAYSVCLAFESVAFEKGLELTTEITPHLTMNGDELQLKQVMAILLDNAVKYAEEKGKISLSLHPKQDKILIQVYNTGAPIPPEEIPHLFERFYRADKSRSQQKEGYGLGLSIAKSIVVHHQGKISVDSSAAKGTTFTLQLPTH